MKKKKNPKDFDIDILSYTDKPAELYYVFSSSDPMEVEYIIKNYITEKGKITTMQISTCNSWAESVHGKPVAIALDNGNGIKFLVSPFSKEMDYQDLYRSMVFTTFLGKNQAYPEGCKIVKIDKPIII